MLLLIPLIIGYSVALFETSVKLIYSFTEYWQFLSGAIAGILLFPLLSRRKFIRTFEHEMTHLIFAKLFFGRIKELNVTSEGEGFVEYTATPNPFIGLSPYFFPLFSVFISTIIPLLNPVFAKYFYIASGFFLTNHLLSSVTEIFSSQPDIRNEGIIFSLIFISFFLIFIYGLILAETISYSHILIFIKEGFVRSVSSLIHLKNLIISLFASL